jgi:hypothetical protein
LDVDREILSLLGKLWNRFFEEVGMVFEELVFEFLIQLSQIEGFGFGQEIDGDVGHSKKVSFL